MINTLTPLKTFDEFIDWYPQDSVNKYELYGSSRNAAAHWETF